MLIHDVLRPALLAAGAALLAACDGPDQAAAPALPATATAAPFADATAALGLDHSWQHGGTGQFHMPEIMGGGAALFDADNDGDLDLYLVQGGNLAAGGGPDRLYRNNLVPDGALGFTDVTAASGLPADGYGMGVVAGDVDGDGRVDLYVSNHGGNRLLRNLGGLRFADISAASGTDDPRWSVPAALFDLEGDGDLDLFVGNYVDFRIANHKDCASATGLPDYCSPHSYNAVPDSLYLNDGSGRFTDISARAGIRAVDSKALGVVPGDFDGDGRVDLYVANDGVANQLWLNRGDGRFEDTALLAGCALNFEGVAEASMGVDAADVDADGNLDLFMTHLRGETNTLYLNRGDATFEDGTIRIGLAGPSIQATGFGTAWVDVDNNGHLDLVAVNGAVTIEDRLAQAGDPFPYHQPNQLFLHAGGTPPRYREHPAGPDDPLAQSATSRGAAFGDIDNDGDLDLVVVNINAPAQVLLNQAADGHGWLGLLPVQASGAPALGAVVSLTRADGLTMVRTVQTAGSYASARDPRLVFGLGTTAAAAAQQVTVQWPGGLREQFAGLRVGRYQQLVRGTGTAL